MSKPVCVVWMNEAKVYERALAREGLADKIELHRLNLDQRIPDEVAERTEVLVGWRPGSHCNACRVCAGSRRSPPAWTHGSEIPNCAPT